MSYASSPRVCSFRGSHGIPRKGERPEDRAPSGHQWGKPSHFQPAPTAAAAMSARGTAMRTNQFTNRMSGSLGGGWRGRLLIGIASPWTLPSEGDQDWRATGSSKLNVDPSPGADSTQM